MFTAEEQPKLLARPAAYDVPVFKAVKVHRDFHAEVAKALYPLPQQWIGTTLDVRADSELVKFYHRGQVVKTRPRQPAGARSTDRADLPEQACSLALDLDVVSVNKIASMLERATDNTTPTLPRAVGHTSTQFSRDPSEYASTSTLLTVVPDAES